MTTLEETIAATLVEEMVRSIEREERLFAIFDRLPALPEGSDPGQNITWEIMTRRHDHADSRTEPQASHEDGNAQV